MRKLIFIVAVMCVCSGWLWQQKKDAAIVIGDIAVTAREFEDALAETRFDKNDPAQRKEFLDSFISRKLILREAERQGLDKDPEFLRSLQLFWEQSLLKTVLARKMNEVSATIKVDQKEIGEYYQEHQSEFGEKTLSEVSSQIHWILLKEKQRAAIEAWSDSLRKKTAIDIDYGRLGIEKK